MFAQFFLTAEDAEFSAKNAEKAQRHCEERSTRSMKCKSIEDNLRESFLLILYWLTYTIFNFLINSIKDHIKRIIIN